VPEEDAKALRGFEILCIEEYEEPVTLYLYLA
jgi:hypothetical protein